MIYPVQGETRSRHLVSPQGGKNEEVLLLPLLSVLENHKAPVQSAHAEMMLCLVQST
jgi:hypothetical protein